MLPIWFLYSPLPGMITWAAVYVLDYARTLIGARLYQTAGQNVLEFEGSYELTPVFQEDIDQMRAVSRRFVLALILYEGLLFIFWALAVRLLGWWQLYEAILGVLLLMQAAIHLRHTRNIQMFRFLLRHPAGAEGHVRYRRALILWNSVWDLVGVGALLATLALLLGSWFLGGGALGVLVLALRHAFMQRKALNDMETAVNEPTQSTEGA